MASPAGGLQRGQELARFVPPFVQRTEDRLGDDRQLVAPFVDGVGAQVLLQQHLAQHVVGGHGHRPAVGVDDVDGADQLEQTLETDQIEGDHPVDGWVARRGPHVGGHAGALVEAGRGVQAAPLAGGVHPVPERRDVGVERRSRRVEHHARRRLHVAQLQLAAVRRQLARLQEHPRPRSHLGVVRREDEVAAGPGQEPIHPGGSRQGPGHGSPCLGQLGVEAVICVSQRSDQAVLGAEVERGSGRVELGEDLTGPGHLVEPLLRRGRVLRCDPSELGERCPRCAGGSRGRPAHGRDRPDLATEDRHQSQRCDQSRTRGAVGGPERVGCRREIIHDRLGVGIVGLSHRADEAAQVAGRSFADPLQGQDAPSGVDRGGPQAERDDAQPHEDQRTDDRQHPESAPWWSWSARHGFPRYRRARAVRRSGMSIAAR